MGPAMYVLVLTLILFAVEGIRRTPRATAFAAIPSQEMLLATGFACIPLIGMIGCKLSHGPFFDRYFLSSIAGYAIFLGFAVSCWKMGSWTANTLTGCILLLMVADFGTTVYLSVKGKISLLEPSTGLVLSTTPSDPMHVRHTNSGPLRPGHNGPPKS